MLSLTRWIGATIRWGRIAARITATSSETATDGTHAELLASTPLYADVLAQAGELEAQPEGVGR